MYQIGYFLLGIVIKLGLILHLRDIINMRNWFVRKLITNGSRSIMSLRIYEVSSVITMKTVLVNTVDNLTPTC